MFFLGALYFLKKKGEIILNYYITGDIHGDYKDLKKRILSSNIVTGDCLIILGDACFNYFRTKQDDALKAKANELGVTIFCIQGNHEIRPQNITSYITKNWNGGTVWYQPEFSNILFAKDGEIYNINGNKTLVIGGAYSVDKYYRAARYYLSDFYHIPMNVFRPLLQISAGDFVSKEEKELVDNFLEEVKDTSIFKWWKDEQISDEDMKKVNDLISKDNSFDIVLSHTCPQKFEPTEVFLPSVNQGDVDKRMENWFNEIESKIKYKKWFAGHYHIDKNLNNGFGFLFKSVRKVAAKADD